MVARIIGHEFRERQLERSGHPTAANGYLVRAVVAHATEPAVPRSGLRRPAQGQGRHRLTAWQAWASLIRRGLILCPAPLTLP